MRRGLLWAGAGLVGLAAAALLARFDHAPLPNEASLLNPERHALAAAYDVLGRAVTEADADALRRTEAGRALLLPASGAVRVDADLVRAGREAFYRETYGNEVFITDVLGMLDGGLTLWNVGAALAWLAGRGTSNLEVRLARTIQVGDRTFEKGTPLPTGLDVPRGGLVPLGVKLSYDRGRVRMGITCALCHSTVDAATGRVVEGAPNTDLNVGLMMALSANPAAYFIHTSVPTIEPYRTADSPTVVNRAGAAERLPEPERFGRDVRAMLGAWAPGSFDSSPDLVNNPASTPSSWTAEAHPYGWSGHAGIGPFRGLTALNNNVHALNSDELAQAEAAPVLFGMDPEVYLGILLQRAPREALRYRPGGPKPSAVLAAADPTPGQPGVNTFAVLPSFPNANYVTTNGLVASRPDESFGRSINAMSPFQNTLRPPPAPAAAEVLARGRAAFERAGCAACHAGPAHTNNRVVPVEEVGTEPTRARAFARTEATIVPPELYAPDTPTPPPAGARRLAVPVEDPDQVRLAWAHGGTRGGYKVPSLVGLAWSAPYLHDAGVAAGRDPGQFGLPGTLFAGVAPDPAASLRALLDRSLRDRVVAANRASPRARATHATGEGHAYWADAEAGFTPDEQDALIAYLLAIDRVEAPR